MPSQEQIKRILGEIRAYAVNTSKKETDHQYINRIITWYSRRVVDKFWSIEDENRVAQSDYIIRAYISLCWNCKNIYDCGNSYCIMAEIENNNIRGPCVPTDLTEIAKEFFTYE